MTVTRCGAPLADDAVEQGERSSDSSSRPISGVDGAGDPRGAATVTRTASQAGTGSDLPFRSSGSSSVYSIELAVRRWVTSPTVTLPGRAAACRRAATFTGSPITV